MSGAFVAMTLALLPFVAGCSCDCDDPVVVDSTPPNPPDGVFSVTRDGGVEIYWIPGWEGDLAGYRIYRARPNDTEFTLIGTTDADDVCPIGIPLNPYSSEDFQCYEDFSLAIVNGDTWYYAVTSVDQNGNESDYAYEVEDTPRPEGYDLVLVERSEGPNGSGFNFENETVQAWDALDTDIYFEFGSDGVFYIVAGTGVSIQDWGVIDLLSVDWAPSSGWAASGRAEVTVGHSYVIRIRTGQVNHYAAVEIRDLTPGAGSRSITVDWAYQTDDDNQQLFLARTGGDSQ